MNNQNNLPEASNWLNLSYFQRRGIQDFGLTLNQVQSENFGEHTLRSIHFLEHHGRVTNRQLAFQQVQGLNRYQAHLVVRLGFDRYDVMAPNFGEHTLDSVYTLMNQGRYPNPYRALEAVIGLDHFQTTGIVYFGLERRHVLSENFGEHSLAAIRELRANNQNLSDIQAFQIIQGLDPYQVRGRSAFNLSREQVQSENFGEHTIITMIRLLSQNRAQNPNEAFELLRGLNRDQIWGIDQYRLRREDVLTPNFGRHTLLGLDELRFASNVTHHLEISYQTAFEQLRGLNEVQVRGVTEFNLNRQQVLADGFDLAVLQTMQALQTLNINADSDQLYDTAMQLPEYQIRAITVYGFIPQQLGLYFNDDKFVQFEREHVGIISGSMVDAIAHLMTSEVMNRNEAYRVSLTLNSNQIIGMIDFGLNLNQVQSALFLSSKTILGVILDNVRLNNKEIELPLLPDQQERAREIMELMMKSYNELENTAQQTAFQVGKAEESIPYNIPSQSNFERSISPSAQNVLFPEIFNLSQRANSREFLEYAQHRDIFGIFDGITEAMDAEINLRQNNFSDTLASLDEQILESVLRATGVASRPLNDELSVSSSESSSEARLDAFKKPNFSRKKKKSSSKKTYLKDLEKTLSGAEEDKKPSPKPRGKRL